MTGGSPALAQGLAEVFALELDEQLRAAQAAWPRAATPATRADACRDLARVFHTIKGGAGLAGRDELAAAARLLERFFADPAADSMPPQAALDALFAAAALPPPRLEALHRALAAPEVELATAEELIPIAAGDLWLAIRLRDVRWAVLVVQHATSPGSPSAAAAPAQPGDRADSIDFDRAVGIESAAERRVALALHGGATLIVERVRAPLSLAVSPPHRLLALHPWLAGTAIDADGRPLGVIDPARVLAGLSPTATAAGRAAARRAASSAVLIVDDSLVAREAAATALRGAGVGVDMARDGREALAKLERAAYAVVLSDLEMPQLDGFGLIARLRASEVLCQQPVVVCSSRLDAEARRRLDHFGVSGFVAKPFAAEELLAVLQPWLES